MANEIFKELKTRIALKYNTYEYWTTGEGKDYAPLKGEVCFCAIESKDQGAQTAPTVLFKVGVDGQTKFSALKWASALAADVYDWAKVAGVNVFTKDGTGNVVSGIEYDDTLNGGKGGFKFTTASVATAEGFKDLQDAVATIEKDITDNRNAWFLDTDTRYSFSTDGDKLVVKKTLYTNGVAGAEEAVGTYEFLTAAEVAETLKDYYTKDEADAKFVTGLAEGATNGTIKAVVNGVSGADVKVHGLQDAAYVTVESLNTTAKGYADAVEAKLPTSADYGVLEVKGDEASGVVVDNTDAQRPTIKIAANTYDAHGAAAAVLGTSADGAAANTVYGAKAAAAAAQSDATIAKTKIETFLGTVTPDGSQDIIDTLAEINNYVGEHGEEFAALSGKVTNIENGTTHTVAKSLDEDAVAQVKGVKVDNATNADAAADADKLDGHDSEYFATAESVTNITKDNGTIDTKIAAYNTSKNFGDIITHNAGEFAGIKEDGAKALADENKLAIDAINNAETGILAQAKAYSDGLNHEDTKYTAAADGGLKLNESNEFAIDDTVVFVLDCNW